MIIGLTGSFGAGKGAVVEYLTHKKDFTHFSARSFIVREIERRGLPVNRDSMILVANELRAAHEPEYVVASLFREAEAHGGNVVIESLRAVAEARFIKAHGGVVIGIDAEPRVRYERILKRGSETDHVSYEVWKAQEERETNPDDPTKQDIFGTLRESDYIVKNSHSLAELYSEIDRILERIDKK